MVTLSSICTLSVVSKPQQFAIPTLEDGRMPWHTVIPEQHHARRPRSHFVSRVLWRLLRLLNYVSISRLGSYSAKRVDALDKYCEHTCLFRVILVGVLMPLPALLLELASEMIPLRDPAEGWKANIGAWIRLCLLITSTSAGSLYQVRATTPDLSCCKIICISITTGCGSTLTLVLLASVWVFPLPFCLLLTCFPAIIFFVTLFLCAINHKTGRFIGTVDKPLKMKVYLILVQAQLSFVYITFGVIFDRCSYMQRFGLLLFLPFMKLALKHYVAWLASDNMESIPAVAVFSVDVFHGLYSSICMQSSVSWWTSIIMIMLNTVHTVLSMMEINRAATSFLSQNRTRGAITHLNYRRVAVIPAIQDRDRSPSLLQSAKLATRLAPSTHDIEVIRATTKLPSAKGTTTANQVETSSKLLFHLEYRVLVGYIESVIPLLYAVHLSIVSQLPSAKFYPHTQSLTNERLQSTVGSILAYTLAEIASLVWLHVVIKRKLGFSLLYQLAFVLETETELLQGRLFVWIVILLQLTLVHYGTLARVMCWHMYTHCYERIIVTYPDRSFLYCDVKEWISAFASRGWSRQGQLDMDSVSDVCTCKRKCRVFLSSEGAVKVAYPS